jgi:hypothetical protein
MTQFTKTAPAIWLIPLIVFAPSTMRLPAAEPVRVFRVRDYGAAPGGSSDCGAAIRAAIQAALAAGEGAEVALEAGTYRVKADGAKGYCFPVQQAKNLLIRGAGKATRIVITNPATGGFLLAQCQQVCLRDLTIDYDPLPFCQGTIRAADVEAGWFDLEIEHGYTTPDAGNFTGAQEPYGKWGMIIDPATRRIKAGTPDHYMTPRWEHREGRVWRFFTDQEHYRRGLVHMTVGDAYVHLARGYGAAVLAQACEDLRIENVTVHASPGLAVGLVANRGQIVVHGLQVRFAPDSTRLLTTDADGVHCQQNRTGPIIEHCYFEGMADDAINIYAPPNVLREVRSPTEWLVSPNCLVLPGDRLQVLDPKTGGIRGEVKAVTGKIEGRAFLLNLDKPLDGVVAGADHLSADTLYNLDACGAGFQIRNNHMRGNRRYGCLLRAGGGVVENNVFEDTTGAGVVLTNEPNWPEGPMPWAVTIRGNRFLRGGTCLGYADSPHGAALAVRATRLGHGLAEAESIRDIVIDGNEFIDRAGAAIFVGGATNVTIRNNRVTASADAEHRRSGGAIFVQRSSAVVIQDNQVADSRPDTKAAVEIGAHVAPGEAGVRVDNLKATLWPEAKPVLDHRQ